MEQTFNKLVRDKIPDKIESNGEVAITRVLSDYEYKIELYKKLLEESNEVIRSKTKEELIEELADVYEILRALANLNDETMDKVIEEADKKRSKRGGFDNKIYLEKTMDKKE